MIHRLALLEHGNITTLCGVRLSDTDTAMTCYGSPIKTTHFDANVTCRDCINGGKRPRTKLRIVK